MVDLFLEDLFIVTFLTNVDKKTIWWVQLKYIYKTFQQLC